MEISSLGSLSVIPLQPLPQSASFSLSSVYRRFHRLCLLNFQTRNTADNEYELETETGTQETPRVDDDDHGGRDGVGVAALTITNNPAIKSLRV